MRVCGFHGLPMEGESVSMLWACASLAKVTVLKHALVCLFVCSVTCVSKCPGCAHAKHP